MKKVLLLTFLLLFILNISKVYATQGACSSHFGVNCSTGMSTTGNVICNDGWTDSSVAYTDMNECMNKLSCTQAEYDALESKYGVLDDSGQLNTITGQINDIYSQKQDLVNQMNNLDSQTLNGIQQSGGIVTAGQLRNIELNKLNDLKNKNRQLTEQYNQLKSQGDSLQLNMTNKTTQVNNDCHQMAVSGLYAKMNKIIAARQIQSQVNNNQDSTPIINKQKTEIVTKTSAKMTPEAECLMLWGEHTHPSKDKSEDILSSFSTCACDKGYFFPSFTIYNAKINKCTLIKNIDSVAKLQQVTTLPSKPIVTENLNIKVPWYKKFFNFLPKFKFW